MDFDYLKTDYKSLVIDKDELIKTLDLVSRVAQTNSNYIESNSLSFIPDWEHKSLILSVNNTLTYFKNTVEIMGNSNNAIEEAFSIKIDTLNKIKSYFKDKVLIYQKEDNYYIRLIDGDLLLSTKSPDITRLVLPTVAEDTIYEDKVNRFCKILSYYKNMADSYSDKWLSFDGEKLSLCGLNFYAETEIKTPIMCFLMTDVDLLIKLDRYYSDNTIQIFNTLNKSKLHIKVGSIEIELLNVLSNINKSSIDKLSSFISKTSYSISSEALKRVLNIALSLSEINKDCTIKVKNNNIVIILNDSKGESEFNLMTQKLDFKSEVEEVKLNVDTLSKIVNSINANQIELALNKIYTTVHGDNIKTIILNK